MGALQAAAVSRDATSGADFSLLSTNPFDGVTVDGKAITSYAKVYDPPSTVSTSVYEHIRDSISGWIDTAIRLRR